VRCIDEGTPEIALPWLSAKLCTLGYLSPALTRLFRPAMEKRGARNKRAYIERKRAARWSYCPTNADLQQLRDCPTSQGLPSDVRAPSSQAPRSITQPSNFSQASE